MRELHINHNDCDQRVDKFLTKSLPALPKSLMYKMIRNKKIKVNRKRCEISQRLQDGDVMQLFIAEEFFDAPLNHDFLKAPYDLMVVYEDEHLLIVDKPVGLLAHSDRKDDVDTLMNRIKHYLYEKQEYDPSLELSFAPALCHRIDRNTQGLVIAAKDAASLRLMNAKIKDRQVDKVYQCIVEGHMPRESDTIMLYHKKNSEENRAQLSDRPKEGYKAIKTSYRVLEKGKHHDLLEIQLHTGKSHQIRATMAYVKHPLLSDIKYGAKKTTFPYQALCAYQLRFHFAEDELLSYLDGKSFYIKHSYLQEYFHSNRI